MLNRGDLLLLLAALDHAFQRGAACVSHPADFEHAVAVQNKLERLLEAEDPE